MSAGLAEKRGYRLEEAIRYRYDAPIRRLRHRLVVVPRARHGEQVRTNWELEVCGAEATCVARTDAFGNHVVEVAAERVQELIEFRIRAEVGLGSHPDGHVRRHDGPTAQGSGPDAGGVHDVSLVAPTPLTRPSRVLIRAATSMMARSSGIEEFARRACSFSHASLIYQYGVTTVKTTAACALAEGKGVCQDFAHVMLALCRSVGVAARYVSGHLLGEGGSHAWVEVLLSPAQALALDPTHDRPAADGYLTVAVGRDYADVSPTSGTFSGRAFGALTVSKRLCLLGPPAS